MAEIQPDHRMTMSDANPHLMVRLLHPGKKLSLGADCADLASKILGLDADSYAACVAQIDRDRAEAVERVAAGIDIAAWLRQPPFPTGSRILCLGDSLTDDRASWSEMLALLSSKLNLDFTIINCGYSGETTSQLLERLPQMIALKPDIALCLAGTNDTRRFSGSAEAQLTPRETERNLRLLRQTLRDNGVREWVWMTPIGIDPIRADVSAFWRLLGTTWNQRDVSEMSRAVRQIGGNTIDLEARFGDLGLSDFLTEDGVHLTIAGQAMITIEVISQLSSQFFVDDL